MPAITVLGVRPAEPGFRSVRVAPHLGLLQRAEGRVPHPLGDIEVGLVRAGERGVRAAVTLPAGLTGVLRPREGESVDCPNVFRHDGRWYMLYVAIRNEVGYETRLAASDDLLRWTPLGTVLPFE
jgi:hypothetical protein